MESELISIIFVRRYLRNSWRKGKVEICKDKYQLVYKKGIIEEEWKCERM